MRMDIRSTPEQAPFLCGTYLPIIQHFTNNRLRIFTQPIITYRLIIRLVPATHYYSDICKNLEIWRGEAPVSADSIQAILRFSISGRANTSFISL